MSPLYPQWFTLLSILFCVTVMIYGWGVLFWASMKRGQFSLLSLFVLVLFIAIGVGVPLLLLRFHALDVR